MKNLLAFTFALTLSACAMNPSLEGGVDRGLVPAETFANSVKSGNAKTYSVYRSGRAENGAVLTYTTASSKAHKVKDTHYDRARMRNGALKLQKSWDVPSPKIYNMQNIPPAEYYHPLSQKLPGPPPGSSAPYHLGPMTANPSLWPDNGESASLFRDFRASQPMDVITIVVNESSTGKKKADTDASNSFDLLSGITEFFGIETREWMANNASLDPATLVKANSSLEFKGEGETKRSGSLSAKISAVIMEQLPNGLLRVEGTKIVSINSEEEILVISGLVRQRDITASNQVDSSRIANMRIDFYGQGVVANQQKPGWGARLFQAIWPF